MSKRNSDFFTKKKAWSEIKDTLLRAYLLPYFTKVLRTGKPILYVDCFAGAGRFDDGSLGSPLIAMHCRSEALKITKVPKAESMIEMIFIEKTHAAALRKNVDLEMSHLRGIKPKVIAGECAEELMKLSSSCQEKNVFYIWIRMA